MIYPIPAFYDNYIWTIIDEQAGMLDCVDPGEALPVISYAQAHQLTLRAIFLTHHHSDHIGGVAQLKEYYPNCTIYGPQDHRIPLVTHEVFKDDKLVSGANTFRVLFNPGHTSTHISYFEPEKKWLFCGDTLFSAGCGRVFDGTIEELHDSLQLFKTLPLDTLIFCAHEYTLQNLKFAHTVEPDNTAIKNHIGLLSTQSPVNSLPSTLELELVINPFLRTGEPAVKNHALMHGAESNTSLAVFKTLRKLKDIF